jgi:hypothetical protein
MIEEGKLEHEDKVEECWKLTRSNGARAILYDECLGMRAGSNVTDYGVDQAQQAYIDCIVMRPLVAQMSVLRHPEISLLVDGP